MKSRTISAALLCLSLLAAGLAAPKAAHGQTIQLPAGPGPVDNPLKGWCTYTSAGPIYQPYSMVFQYISWKDVEPVEGEYNFADWERKSWDTPAAAGRRVVFRVFIDYPNTKSGIPDWLLAKGLKTTTYSDYGGGKSPDYSDPHLVEGLMRLIAALGKRYDHDPRVAGVQLGLLGYWGEWHTYPNTKLFASPAVQQKVVDAYHAAFPDKPLMARYAGDVTGTEPWLGYHDDMFPSDTLGPDDWMFLPRMRSSGRTGNWKTAPIGGEMEPLAADKWLGTGYDQTMTAVESAHMTWIGPYNPALDNNTSPEFLEHSQAILRKMGYQYRLQTVHLSKSGGQLQIALTGTNEGVAPFYEHWPVTFVLLNRQHQVVRTINTNADIRTWLPGQFTLNADAKVPATANGDLLGIGIIDPISNKPGVKFANSLPVIDHWTILTTLHNSH